MPNIEADEQPALVVNLEAEVVDPNVPLTTSSVDRGKSLIDKCRARPVVTMALVAIALFMTFQGSSSINKSLIDKATPTTSKALRPPTTPDEPFVRSGQEPHVTVLVSIGNGLDIVSKETPSTRTTASSTEQPWIHVRSRELFLNLFEFKRVAIQSLDVETVHEEAEKLAHNDNIKYIRLNPPLPMLIRMDESNQEVINQELLILETWLAEEAEGGGAAQMRAVVQALRANAGVSVLALDGGGMRGYVQKKICQELERRAGEPLSGMFNLVAGTSIGGAGATVIALSGELETAHLRADSLLKALRKAFVTRWYERFPPYRYVFWHNIEPVIEELLNSLELDESSWQPRPTKKADNGGRVPYYFLVAATSSKQRSLKAVLLCNHNAPGCVSDMPLWASVAASAAAPWYFPAHLHTNIDGNEVRYVDGACAANNPTIVALNHAKSLIKLQEEK